MRKFGGKLLSFEDRTIAQIVGLHFGRFYWLIMLCLSSSKERKGS